MFTLQLRTINERGVLTSENVGDEKLELLRPYNGKIFTVEDFEDCLRPGEEDKNIVLLALNPNIADMLNYDDSIEVPVPLWALRGVVVPTHSSYTTSQVAAALGLKQEHVQGGNVQEDLIVFKQQKIWEKPVLVEGHRLRLDQFTTSGRFYSFDYYEDYLSDLIPAIHNAYKETTSISIPRPLSLHSFWIPLFGNQVTLNEITGELKGVINSSNDTIKGLKILTSDGNEQKFQFHNIETFEWGKGAQKNTDWQRESAVPKLYLDDWIQIISRANKQSLPWVGAPRPFSLPTFWLSWLGSKIRVGKRVRLRDKLGGYFGSEEIDGVLTDFHVDKYAEYLVIAPSGAPQNEILIPFKEIEYLKVDELKINVDVPNKISLPVQLLEPNNTDLISFFDRVVSPDAPALVEIPVLPKKTD